MKRLVVSLISIFFLPLILLAEEGANKHITKWLQLDKGLSNNFIVSLDIDRYGVLWIGTEEGMNRFDGVSISSFTKYSGVLPGNELNRVVSDRFNDKVWIASQRSGMASYDYSTGQSLFIRHGVNPELSLPSNEITYVAQDDRGDIWFSTYNKGIGKYEVTTGKMTLYNSGNVKGMPDNIIRSFVIGEDNNIYAAYYGSGIVIIDPENRTAVQHLPVPGDPASLPSNEIGSIYRSKDNNIWIGTRRGLALYRKVTKDFTVFDKNNSGLPDGLIFSVLVTSDNKLLASPDFNGVWEMDLNDMNSAKTFTRLPETEEIMNIGIHAMCEDRFGNLWLGSYGSGLMFISRNALHFSNIIYPFTLSERSVTDMDFMGNGKMIVGTDGGGIDILDRDLRNTGKSGHSLPDKSILSIFCDSDGHYWIGSFNGYTAVVDSSMNLLATVDIREVRSFYEHGDTMWVASGLSGLYAVDRKEYKKLNRYGSAYFPDNYIKSIGMDQRGRLWVGTFRSGLFILDKNMNSVASFNTDKGFPSNSINHMLLDSRGDMWVASGEGLVCFSTGDDIKYDKIYSARDGLSSENIRAIVEDNDNTIWFSTNLSICHLDLKLGKITEYSYRSGIANGNYAPGAGAIRDDGLISFGSTEGITCFYPNKVANPGTDLPTHFSEMQIFDANDPITGENPIIFLSGKESIVLRHNQNSFNVSFAVDNFGLADNIEYSYKVEGKDHNWFLSKHGNFVSFHQLAPGKYTLYVRSRLTDGEWSEHTASLEINIRPPFYATTTAYIIYTLIFIGLVYILLFLYTTKIERDNELKLEKASISHIREVNEERLRFYTNITHELKTPLTLILGPTEDLKNDESLPDVVRKKIAVAHKNASSLLDLINQLLNFRKTETNNVVFKPSYGNLSSFIEDIGTIFSESNPNKNTIIRLDIAKDVMATFDHEIMTTILNNLLSNAMKYTPSGSVTLGLKTENISGQRSAVISVADTGLGIDKDQYEKIFDRYYQIPGRQQAQGNGIGLSLVKNLVAIHNGTVSVESEIGKGSVFTVRIPLESIQEFQPSKLDTVNDTEANSTRPIVVIAEDNKDIREYIKSSLLDNYEVYTAKDGQEGYSLAIRYMPDIIISDIMMPVMDGLQLCEKVKQHISLSHIPVILLTAKDTNEDRSEGYKSGADSYITKPFTSEMLNARIQNLLESRKNLARQYIDSNPENQPMKVALGGFSSIDNEFLQKITNYIEDNLLSDDLDIGSLAEKMNMSPSSLYRKLKGLIGISAIEFIRKIKMRKAAEMLASGNFNVSETTWNVGINSMIYFRQCFKDEFGMSPSEYKKKHQPGQSTSNC
jgi:signal transduction histidine kinase/ligand-binding sensor domain-containing protein/CheY-like chemotaxis protein/AraC-like DNA-binding protein